MNAKPGDDGLNREIFDAVTEFVLFLMQRGERLAERLDVPASCVKAIRLVGAAASMKELGQRLHCDPSFVTMIADSLEQRGLAKREPSTADRRIKNLVLTPSGLEIKEAIEAETRTFMPWALALTVPEREQLLSFVRKMNETLASGPQEAPAGMPHQAGSPEAAAEEVGSAASTAVPAVS
jgi:DNA-binding MarR family transcriptional regulator